MVRLLSRVSICVLIFIVSGVVFAGLISANAIFANAPFANVLFADVVLAQDGLPGARESEIEARVIAQVEQVVREARSLKLTENRLRLQTKAAVLLWPYKEQAARALFDEALDSFLLWM